MNTKDVIVVNNVSKTYIKREKKAPFMYERKQFVAVDRVSFKVKEGEIVGYLGMNGAGKSTTVKMLSGILVPTFGDITVCGKNPIRDRKMNARISGTVFGQRSQLWWDLPVWDSFVMSRYMYGLSHGEFISNYGFLNRYLALDEIKHTPVRQLSLGQRMRADLAFSLLHNPRILFLDEPTIGLDLITKQQVHACIKELNANRELTTILTTHDISDIEELCSRAIIIDHGRVILDNSLPDLIQQFGSHIGVSLKLTSMDGVPAFLDILERDGVNYSTTDSLSFNLQVPHAGFFESGLFRTISKTVSIETVLLSGSDLKNVLTTIYQSLGRSQSEKD